MPMQFNREAVLREAKMSSTEDCLCPKCGFPLVPPIGQSLDNARELYCWSCDLRYPNPRVKNND